MTVSDKKQGSTKKRRTKMGVAVSAGTKRKVATTKTKKTAKGSPSNSSKPNRKKTAKKKPNHIKRRTTFGRMLWLAKWAAILGLLLAALGTATIATMLWVYGTDSSLPKIESLKEYNPARVNRIVDADGVLIGELFEQRRSLVRFEDIPKTVVDAFVSAEDKGFWKHEGIDYIGMVRATLVNIRSGKKKQGASTITQQVVKNLLLTRERTFRRKFQEIILARRLEKGLNKKEILTLYANEIFFGHGRYGVQEASRYYFGKNLADINIGEAAVLAGLPKGPNLYTPKKEKNYERAKARQIYVLQEMRNNGYISEEDAQHWIDEPISVVADAAPQLGEAPEFVELARAELVSQIGEDALQKSGHTLVTTVDLTIQKLARNALQKNLRAFDQRKKYGRPLKHLKENKMSIELLRLSKKLGKKGPLAKKVYRAIVLEAHDKEKEVLVDLGNYEASILLVGRNEKRFNPEGKKASERFTRGDVVRVMAGKAQGGTSPKHAKKQVVLASGPEGAVVVLNPKNRELLALVGGYDIQLAGFNRATMAKRQAGSTFKPFVYAAAIDSGDFTACSIVNDAPEVYDLWKPENYKKGAFAGPVRLRHALAKSINTVAIRVAHDIGPERIKELAKGLGVHSKLPDGLSLALGSGEVTPLELTNAFASIRDGGKYLPPRSISKVGGTVQSQDEARQVLRPEVAYIVTDMMRSVMEEGTGASASKLKLSLAGKTGTSNNARDAWFVGMSPELVVGVWVGFDDFRRELGRGEGGSKTALPVFIDIMRKLGRKSSSFTMPENIERVRIDKASGLLAADGVLDNTYEEVFIMGSAPTEVAVAADEVDAEGDAILDQYGDFDEPKDKVE